MEVERELRLVVRHREVTDVMQVIKAQRVSGARRGPERNRQELRVRAAHMNDGDPIPPSGRIVEFKNPDSGGITQRRIGWRRSIKGRNGGIGAEQGRG